MLDQFKENPKNGKIDMAEELKKMSSFKNGNDMLLDPKSRKEEKKITDYSVQELLAQLEAKGQKIAIIDPNAESQAQKQEQQPIAEEAQRQHVAFLNERPDLEDSDPRESPQNGEATKTGTFNTFGSPKLNGTINEAY